MKIKAGMISVRSNHDDLYLSKADAEDINDGILVVPNTISGIQLAAIHRLDNLREVIIPPSVRYIRTLAINACPNLRVVKISPPPGILEIERGSIIECNKLRYIVIDSDDPEEIDWVRREFEEEALQNKVVSRGFYNRIKNIEALEYEKFLFIVKPYISQFNLNSNLQTDIIATKINAFVGELYEDRFVEIFQQCVIPTTEEELEEYAIQLREAVNHLIEPKEIIFSNIWQHLNRRACIIKFQHYVDFVQSEINNGANSSAEIENRLAVVLKLTHYLRGHYVEFNESEKEVLTFGYIADVIRRFNIDIDSLPSAENGMNEELMRAQHLESIEYIFNMINSLSVKERLEMLSLNHNGWTIGHEIANYEYVELFTFYLGMLIISDENKNTLSSVALSLLTSVPISYKQNEMSIVQAMASKKQKLFNHIINYPKDIQRNIFQKVFSEEENSFSLLFKTKTGFFECSTSRGTLRKAHQHYLAIKKDDLKYSSDDEQEETKEEFSDNRYHYSAMI